MGALLDNIKIVQVYADRRVSEIVDDVATEVKVKIYIDDVLRAFLDTSPHMLLELGLGYALSNRLQIDEQRILVENFDVKLYKAMEVSRSCRYHDNLVMDIDTIFYVFKNIMGRASMFKKTGCFHVVAIATIDGKVIDVVEDISRHCALYKIIGSAYRKGIDFRKSVIVLSSRATGSLMEGIANVCIPIAIFRGAPTLNAIDIARRNSITLIAHVKKDRINIYSRIERVSF